jgi:hypothetical protein
MHLSTPCHTALRRLRFATAATLCLVASAALAQTPAIGTLRWIGSYEIPTGTLFEGVEFGGISGLDRAPDGTYLAVSDDRGGDRGPPRFYELKIELDAQALRRVSIERMVVLQGPDGQPLPAAVPTVDPEAIRVAPGGHLLIASEGQWSADPARRFQPFVREHRTDGSLVRAFRTPEAFDHVDNDTTGARNNKVFESLAVAPGGAVFVANEEALIDDGPAATPLAGSLLRVVRFNGATGEPEAQFAYALPPIPTRQPETASARADNGLTELLAVSDAAFIAVERAYVPGEGVTVRLVLTRIEADTTDVSGLKSLRGASFKPMSRELLLELRVRHEGVSIDNIEAIAWGPVLPNGHRSLILVSDNNFSRLQTTQFLVWEVLLR